MLESTSCRFSRPPLPPGKAPVWTVIGKGPVRPHLHAPSSACRNAGRPCWYGDRIYCGVAITWPPTLREHSRRCGRTHVTDVEAAGGTVGSKFDPADRSGTP